MNIWERIRKDVLIGCGKWDIGAKLCFAHFNGNIFPFPEWISVLLSNIVMLGAEFFLAIK